MGDVCVEDSVELDEFGAGLEGFDEVFDEGFEGAGEVEGLFECLEVLLMEFELPDGALHIANAQLSQRFIVMVPHQQQVLFQLTPFLQPLPELFFRRGLFQHQR
jgi:hypothetical protein